MLVPFISQSERGLDRLAELVGLDGVGSGGKDGADRVGQVGPGERGVSQNVNVLFAMIASEIKLVKLD